MPLPPLLPVSAIQERLQAIFPAGTRHRNFVTRKIAAKTVFVMLYVGAVVDKQYWLRPDQVTRMTDIQAGLTGDPERWAWSEQSLRSATASIPGRWYAVNTREPIRDETLRDGLVSLGAVKEREGLPTTSPKGRYALVAGFAALFDPALDADAFETAVQEWQAANLSTEGLARVEILRSGAVADKQGVVVTFPSGEARIMAPGPSSVLSRAVVQDFATRFLERPSLLWLSESRTRVVAQDERLLQAIGLKIPTDRVVPDVILADVHPDPLLLVFVEVVATAGAVSELRREALLSIVAEAGFALDHVAFVTAYADRDTRPFKATVDVLAWRSFAWFMSEPEHIVVLRSGSDSHQARLSELMNA